MVLNTQDAARGDATSHTGPPAAQTRVSFDVVDTRNNSRRTVVMPFAELPGTLAGLASAEAVVWYDDDRPTPAENGAPLNGVLALTVERTPGADTIADLHALLCCYFVGAETAPAFGRPLHNANGELIGARFYLPTQNAEWVSTIAGDVHDCAVLDGLGVVRRGDDDVPRIASLVAPLESGERDCLGGLRVDAVEHFNERYAHRAFTVSSLNADERTELAEIRRRLLADEWCADASEAEQLAAIIGDGERPFLAVLREYSGAEVADLWGRLVEASTRYHPLAQVFRETMLRVALASAVKQCAGEPALFNVALNAKSEVRAALDQLDEPAKGLLRRAAWLVAAPADALLGQTSARPSKAIRIGQGNAPRREWLVDGMLPRVGLAAIAAPPASGKSWFATQLALRVAAADVAPTVELGQTTFLDRRITAGGTVVYFTTEDVAGVVQRLEAQSRERGDVAATTDNVFVYDGAPLLSSPGAVVSYMRHVVTEVREAGRPEVRLIIVDVLKGAMTGNENDTQDMGVAVGSMSAIARMTGALVLSAHHTPKADPMSLRGSGVLEGALDWVGIIKKDGDDISLTVKKNKGGRSGETFVFHLETRGEGDAVLCDGPAPAYASGKAPTKKITCALAFARVIKELSKPNGAKWTDVRALLLDEDRFGRLFYTGNDADRDALSRAKTTALQNQWAAEPRHNRFISGPVDPFIVDDPSAPPLSDAELEAVSA